MESISLMVVCARNCCLGSLGTFGKCGCRNDGWESNACILICTRRILILELILLDDFVSTSI